MKNSFIELLVKKNFWRGSAQAFPSRGRWPGKAGSDEVLPQHEFAEVQK